MRKKYGNVKESFGMGEGLHFAQVEKIVKHSKYKDCGFQGAQPLGGVRRRAPAEQLLRINALLACFFMLTSCEKEDAFAIQCIGNDCQPKSAFPICIDEHNLLISDDPTISPVFCPNGCQDDQCVPDNQECAEGTSQCLSDLLLQTCVYGKWMTLECQDLCDDGKCIDQPVLCIDGERRCSDSDVEVCVNGVWTVQETCPYKCDDGKCLEGCSGPNTCLDSTTLQKCIHGEWQTTPCQNGCDNGRCRPEVQGTADPRLVGRLCTRDDFRDDFYLFSADEYFAPGCHGKLQNFLGSVCIAGSIDMTFCLDRCDPNNQSNYYCYGSDTFYAYTADCVQISDGSYALINTSAYKCENNCSPQNGCDNIVQSFGPFGGISCSTNSFYCDGTIANTCYGPINCSDYGNKVCVQFGIPTYCAVPCENEGDSFSECIYQMSNTATCVRDDLGTLTWQYTPPTHCENDCNNTTGLCN